MIFSDLADVIGPRLPNEIYFLLSQGAITPQVQSDLFVITFALHYNTGHKRTHFGSSGGGTAVGGLGRVPQVPRHALPHAHSLPCTPHRCAA